MKPDRSRLTTKAITVLLALALMAGAFTACSAGNGSGNGGAGGRTEIDTNEKPEYGNEGEEPGDEPADDPATDDNGGNGTAGGPADDDGGSGTAGGPADDDNGSGSTGNGGTGTGSGGSTPGAYTGTAAIPDDYVFNKDNWSVREYTDNGITYTQIQNPGTHGRQAEIDYLLFKVYANEDDAQAAYNEYRRKDKGFDKGRWEEGDNWYISDKWGVTDVTITGLVYREGNILIMVDLAHNKKWIVYDKTTLNGEEPTESSFKGYVLNNVPEIAGFVKEHFLESN